MDLNRSKLIKFSLLFLCGLIGISILYPHLNYQKLLAQGDHGRDLYCFKMTFEGATPYKDYWWQYGPLMPYYYSLFFRVFGISIQSVLLGKTAIVFLSGIVLFLAAAQIMTPLMALVAAMFFWIFRPEFFYTYNHIGGVFFIILLLYFRFLYHNEAKTRFIYLGLGAVVLLSLIRVNIGMACLAAFLASLALGDYFNQIPGRRKKIKYYSVCFTITGLIVAGIYAYFILPLSLSALKQCFPYLSSYRPDTASPVDAFVYFAWIAWKNFTASWARGFFGAVFVCSLVSVSYLFVKQKLSGKQKGNISLIASTLLIFLIVNVHEFAMSASVFRIGWFFPIGLLLLLFIMDTGITRLPKGFYALIIILFAFINVRTALSSRNEVLFYKQPTNYFQHKGTQVYIDNNHVIQQARIPGYPKENQWIKTVKETLDFLEKEEGGSAGKPIVAVPYDGLYYFLSGQNSAVYPLAFFNFINISRQDEQAMIEQMEGKEVDIVLLSNRINSPEPSLGVFGRDYCLVLAQYISNNFEEIAVFGDWQNPPGFVEHHGIKVMRRKLSPKALVQNAS